MTPNLNCEKNSSKNHHFPSIKSWGASGVPKVEVYGKKHGSFVKLRPSRGFHLVFCHMRLDDRCAARRGTLGEVEIGEVLDAICDADDDLGSSFLRISHPRKSLTGSDWVVVSNIIYIYF